MEMIRFCATIHPTWGRVSGMSLVNSRALVKRDHIFIGTLICVASPHHQYQPTVNVEDIINDEPRLRAISDMLQLHEDQSKNVIQACNHVRWCSYRLA